MQNFTFYAPTHVFFGNGKIAVLGEQIKQYSNKILLVYGKGSIKRNGIYDVVVQQLHNNDITFIEFAGVEPNPRISTVQAGARVCKRHRAEFILAVGGGSVIDCAKGIAAAVFYDGDCWDFWNSRTQVTRALPIGTVLTTAASGSEMNDNTVIVNDETKEKRGMRTPLLFPKFSILDPTYTFSVPPYQTAVGIADIMAHVYEYYFSPVKTAYLQDSFAESILKTCIKYGPIAYKESDNYEARANLMWASSMALNGILEGKTYDRFNHRVAHAIGAIYGLAHGAALAILVPYWMEYILDEERLDRFVAFAKNVWGIKRTTYFDMAHKGINKTRDFLCNMGLPSALSQVGIGNDRLGEIIQKSMFGSDTLGQFKKLSKDDAFNILVNAL